VGNLSKVSLYASSKILKNTKFFKIFETAVLELQNSALLLQPARPLDLIACLSKQNEAAVLAAVLLLTNLCCQDV
jgi:hypothetical protein